VAPAEGAHDLPRAHGTRRRRRGAGRRQARQRPLDQGEPLRARRQTWTIFNAGEDQQRWYYTELAKAFLDRDPDDELFKTLAVEVESVFPG
jgi:hypothetical protein